MLIMRFHRKIFYFIFVFPLTEIWFVCTHSKLLANWFFLCDSDWNHFIWMFFLVHFSSLFIFILYSVLPYFESFFFSSLYSSLNISLFLSLYCQQQLSIHPYVQCMTLSYSSALFFSSSSSFCSLSFIRSFIHLLYAIFSCLYRSFALCSHYCSRNQLRETFLFRSFGVLLLSFFFLSYVNESYILRMVFVYLATAVRCVDAFTI